MTYTLNSIAPFICLRCIGGSKAYGLETPASDNDIKGVYLAPLPDVLTGEAPTTLQDERHDVQFTELGEFCRQLMLNNSGAQDWWGAKTKEQTRVLPLSSIELTNFRTLLRTPPNKTSLSSFFCSSANVSLLVSFLNALFVRAKHTSY